MLSEATLAALHELRLRRRVAAPLFRALLARVGGVARAADLSERQAEQLAAELRQATSASDYRRMNELPWAALGHLYAAAELALGLDLNGAHAWLQGRLGDRMLSCDRAELLAVLGALRRAREPRPAAIPQPTEETA